MRLFAKTALAAMAISVMACSTAAQPPRQLGPTDVVATVGSGQISLADVDERALQQQASNFGGVKLLQALFEARRAALDELVGIRLIEQEAKRSGLDVATLEQREITAKAAVPTDDEISRWYEENKARVQGAPLEMVKGPIKSYLLDERTKAARQTLIDTLKSKTTVRVMLDPPRQKVDTAGRPSRGPVDAPIEIIEFSDFQCPFCYRAHPTVSEILKTYDKRVHFVYRHFPLPNHPNARPAAEAAACAEEQGKFWEYHDRLFDNQSRLSDADLKVHAAAIGLDAAKFNACFDGHKYQQAVQDDVTAGTALGVTGTPAFFINGRQLEGAQPVEVFKKVIDEELAAKKG